MLLAGLNFQEEEVEWIGLIYKDIEDQENEISDFFQNNPDVKKGEKLRKMKTNLKWWIDKLFDVAIMVHLLALHSYSVFKDAKENKGNDCLLEPGKSCRTAIRDEPSRNNDSYLHIKCGGPVGSEYERLLTAAKREKNENWVCSDCEKEFAKKASLKAHVKTHGEGVSCSLCAYVSKDKSNMEKHQKSVHVKIMKACVDCGHQISDPSNLKAHKNKYHTANPRVFSCTLCEFSSLYKNVVGSHQKIHIN